MRKGFTLIELIVVIAIIAILAAVVAPNAFKAIEKGKRSAAIADFKTVKTASMAFYADTGIWPESRDVILADKASPDEITGWDGPYIDKWPPKTPWGGAYGLVSAAGPWDGDSSTEVFLTLPDESVNSSSQAAICNAIDGDDVLTTGDVRTVTTSAAVPAVVLDGVETEPAIPAGKVLGLLIVDTGSAP